MCEIINLEMTAEKHVSKACAKSILELAERHADFLVQTASGVLYAVAGVFNGKATLLPAASSEEVSMRCRGMVVDLSLAA